MNEPWKYFFYFSAQKCNIFWNTVLYDWVTKFLRTLCLSQTFDSFRCLSIPFWYFFGTCLSFWVAIRVILDTETSKWHHALRFNLFLWKFCIRDQLNSEWIYEDIDFPKWQRKYCKSFYLEIFCSFLGASLKLFGAYLGLIK